MDFEPVNEKARVWSTGYYGERGGVYYSFDKKKIYNLWVDYPYNMTEEEIQLFQEDVPFWADFFRDRIENRKAHEGKIKSLQQSQTEKDETAR